MTKFRSGNRRGASTAEYIIIVSVVLAILIAFFWSSIQPILLDKLDEIEFLISGKKKERTKKERKPGDKDPADPQSDATMSASDDDISYDSTPLNSSGSIKSP